MSPDKLVYMANQIARFMETKPHAEGVAGLASHINDFWEPRMRKQFFEILETGGDGFRPLVREAAEQIRRPV
jgi:formate dehydrogenase subunit delta